MKFSRPTYEHLPGIVPFNRQSGNYEQWKPAAIQLVATLGNHSHPNGYAGFFLGEPQYTTLFATTSPEGVYSPPPPFIAPVPPGERPPPAVTAADTRATDRWNEEDGDYKRFLSDLDIGQKKLLESIGMDDFEALKDPHVNHLKVTMSDIFQHMTKKYEVASTFDDMAVMNGFLTQYTDDGVTDVVTHITTLRNAFLLASRRNNPQAMPTQVYHLYNSVKAHCHGKFSNVLKKFTDDHPTFSTSTFDNLAQRLTIEERTLRATGTTGTSGFGNAVIPAVADPKDAIIARLTKQLGQLGEKKKHDPDTKMTCITCKQSFTAHAKFDRCKHCHDKWVFAGAGGGGGSGGGGAAKKSA